MRTKTLLLTAALGVATAATTMAQVYSANVVGYVNQTFTKGWNLVCNPLENQVGNTVADLYAENLPAGATVYKFVNNGVDIPGYSLSTFIMAGVGWSDPALALLPGEGAFVLIPDDATVDPQITYVGDVMQKADSNMKVQAGFSMVGSKVPQAGLLTTDLLFPAADGDTVYTYAGGYNTATFLGAASMWLPEEPNIKVAEAFWSLKTAAVDWIRDFDANAD